MLSLSLAARAALHRSKLRHWNRSYIHHGRNKQEGQGLACLLSLIEHAVVKAESSGGRTLMMLAG